MQYRDECFQVHDLIIWNHTATAQFECSIPNIANVYCVTTSFNQPLHYNNHVSSGAPNIAFYGTACLLKVMLW